MIVIKSLYCALAGALLLGACASTELSVRVDLYNRAPTPENLRQAEQQMENLHRLSVGLAQAKEQAQLIVSTRVEIAAAYSDVYRKTQEYFLNKREDLTRQEKSASLSEATKPLDDARNSLEAGLNKARRELEEEASRGQKNIGLFLANLPLAQESDATENRKARLNALREIEKAVSSVKVSLNDLPENIGADFSRSVTVFLANEAPWKLVDDAVEKSMQAMKELVAAANARFKARPELGLRLVIDGCALKASGSVSTKCNQNGNVRVMASAPSDLYGALHPADLAVLQDPADPAWIEVTHKDCRKECWNKKFSKAYFYAQGDASVIVAQDSVSNFRVQRASNDPSALIQSQLETTRAIARSTIDILAAVNGIPSTALPNIGADETMQPGTSQPPATAPITEARLRERAKIRRAGFVAFQENLERIRTNLVAAEGAELAAVMNRFAASVEGYETFLQGMASKE